MMLFAHELQKKGRRADTTVVTDEPQEESTPLTLSSGTSR